MIPSSTSVADTVASKAVQPHATSFDMLAAPGRVEWAFPLPRLEADAGLDLAACCEAPHGGENTQAVTSPDRISLGLARPSDVVAVRTGRRHLSAPRLWFVAARCRDKHDTMSAVELHLFFFVMHQRACIVDCFRGLSSGVQMVTPFIQRLKNR